MRRCSSTTDRHPLVRAAGLRGTASGRQTLWPELRMRRQRTTDRRANSISSRSRALGRQQARNGERRRVGRCTRYASVATWSGRPGWRAQVAAGRSATGALRIRSRARGLSEPVVCGSRRSAVAEVACARGDQRSVASGRSALTRPREPRDRARSARLPSRCRRRSAGWRGATLRSSPAAARARAPSPHGPAGSPDEPRPSASASYP